MLLITKKMTSNANQNNELNSSPSDNCAQRFNSYITSHNKITNGSFQNVKYKMFYMYFATTKGMLCTQK